MPALVDALDALDRVLFELNPDELRGEDKLDDV